MVTKHLLGYPHFIIIFKDVDGWESMFYFMFVVKFGVDGHSGILLD